MKRKILSMLLSLLIAFGLWYYVVSVVNPEHEETYKDIPVVLQNENALVERGLMITSEIPSVDLRLKGNRTHLIELNNGNISVMANVSIIEAAGSYSLEYSVTYPGSVPNNAVTIQNRKPNLIPVTVENRITKSVDVVVQYLGSVPEGFIADKENAQLDATEVEISGPESVIKTISQAVIQVDLQDKTETVSGKYSYTLCDETGNAVESELVTTNKESISLSVKIEQVKEINLTVKVLEGGGATEKNTKIKVTPEKIQVTGAEALLENLSYLEVDTIDLGSLEENVTLKVPIKLPEGVTNSTGITEVTVEVELPDLEKKTLTVRNIKKEKVPAGMDVEMITQALEVVVRGPKALIDKIEPEDLTIAVDCSGVQPGTATVKAVIVTGTGYSEVGAMGSYTVSATVRQK